MSSDVSVIIGDRLIPQKKLQVSSNDSLTSVMHFIDIQETGMVVVTDDRDKIVGIVTDGDIRRAIIKGIALSTSIKIIMNKFPLFIEVKKPDQLKDPEFIRFLRGKILDRSFIEKLIERVLGTTFIPVVDEKTERFIGGISVYVTEKKGIFPKIPQLVPEAKDLMTGPVKRILVIGGAGYVGTRLVNLLINEGYPVRVLDNFLWGKDTKDLWEDNPQIEVIEGNVQHIETIVEAMRGVDVVCHLAALVGDPACGLDFPTTLATNYLSTVEIAEVCKYFQINRVIFASTCSVYGASSGDTELHEGSPLTPVSSYARTKIDAERALLEKTDRNFSPTILRKATVYGLSARMRFDLVVNLFTAMAFHQGKITIFGGDQWRPFIHVDDAARGYLNVLSAPISKVKGQIFNLGSTQENYQIIQIGEIIKEFLPETELIKIEQEEDNRNYFVNFNKIQTQLDYNTRWNIRTGVSEMIEQLKQGNYSDWNNPKYSNYKMLKEMKFPALY